MIIKSQNGKSCRKVLGKVPSCFGENLTLKDHHTTCLIYFLLSFFFSFKKGKIVEKALCLNLYRDFRYLAFITVMHFFHGMQVIAGIPLFL